MIKYGLIAGNGQFPFLVLDGARKQGIELSVVAIKEETDKKMDCGRRGRHLGRDRPARQDDLVL